MMKRHARLVLILAIGALCLTAGLASAQGTAQPAPKKINLNTATQAELEGLKGIGPALAQKIIAARPFKAIADLKSISGLSQATYDEIKGLVTVRAPRPAPKTQAAETAPVEPKPKTKIAAAERTAAGAASGLVNINTADKAALENLPGIGAATADNIIAARPFKTVEDLKNVKGIGESKYEKLKGLVTVAAARNIHRAEAQASPKAHAAAEGEKQAVVAAGQEEEAAQPKLQPGQTININTATQAELESLLGIGPVKAQAIIAGRPYAKIEDIMKVRGIKEKTFAKIKDYIVVR